MSRIVLENITKKYGRKTALNNVNLTLESGKIVGLLGENGCGKTTMMKILSGVTTKYSGKAAIEGHKPGTFTKSIVSYLPEETYMKKSKSIEYYLTYFERFYKDFDRNKALSILSSIGISPEEKIDTLSKGNQEKVHLTFVMSRNALVYLLDEPIGGVDVATRTKILKLIIEAFNPEGIILVSSHIISEVEPLLDEVIFIREGEILFHKDADQLREEAGMSIENYFKEVY